MVKEVYMRRGYLSIFQASSEGYSPDNQTTVVIE
jgi:hypothetical protein